MGRITYNDIFRGEEDADLLRIIERNTSEEKRKIIQKRIVEIIENELTPKQREVMTEYFFNNKKMAEIAEEQGISVSSVSAKIIAGKRHIYKFMKYCLRCNICNQDI